VHREVLVESARLRASLTSLRTPDAIHAETAQLAGCDYFVTNDTQLKLPEIVPRLALLAELEQ
jgi:predicted nucleic acid-binding protein